MRNNLELPGQFRWDVFSSSYVRHILRYQLDDGAWRFELVRRNTLEGRLFLVQMFELGFLKGRFF